MDKNREIMIVDDEAGIRALLAEALTEEGFNVTLAEDGEDSLNQMKGREFDLLVTDINMPNINGFELLKLMKRARRREKVILMSGDPIDRSRFKEDSQTVFDHLQKPFRMKHFLKLVSCALEQEEGS